MARTLILGGRVIDPSQALDARRELVLQAGRVRALLPAGHPEAVPRPGDRVLGARGLWVLPGLVDLHVHLRQPGQTRAESVASGTAAAAAGGYTTLVCMPNTRPVLDRPEVVRRLQGVIARQARVKVVIAAALSLGLEGREPSDLEALAGAGAGALSDDGRGTADPGVLHQALERGAGLGLAVLVHAEDHARSAGGVVRSGPVARALGLPGQPGSAEAARVARDLGVLRRAGGRLHLQHLSTARGVRLVRAAKARGLPVSCELTPHHLWLCDLDVLRSAGPGGPDPRLKMNPPLGRPADRQALLEALQDGTADAIASDHAPHLASAKARGFLAAPFGIIGLETSLPLALGLVRAGWLDRRRAVELLSTGPARALGLAAGSLAVGSAADVCVLDPGRVWRLEPGALHSRARNTPFMGWSLQGRAVYTLVDGRVVYAREATK
jgi:dihydroorotase